MAEFIGYKLLHTGGKSGLNDDTLMCCSGGVESLDKGILIMECGGESGDIIVSSFNNFDYAETHPSVSGSVRTGDNSDIEAGCE